MQTPLEVFDHLGAERLNLPALSKHGDPCLDPARHRQKPVRFCRDDTANRRTGGWQPALRRRNAAKLAHAGRQTTQWLDIPASLKATIVERLNWLEPVLRHVVVQASVIGRSFDCKLLAKVAQRPEAQVLEALRQARDLQLLVEDDLRGITHAFTHELVRQIIYQQLLARETLPLHERIARHLESAPDVEPSGGARVSLGGRRERRQGDSLQRCCWRHCIDHAFSRRCCSILPARPTFFNRAPRSTRRISAKTRHCAVHEWVRTGCKAMARRGDQSI